MKSNILEKILDSEYSTQESKKYNYAFYVDQYNVVTGMFIWNELDFVSGDFYEVCHRLKTQNKKQEIIDELKDGYTDFLNECALYDHWGTFYIKHDGINHTWFSEYIHDLDAFKVSLPFVMIHDIALEIHKNDGFIIDEKEKYNKLKPLVYGDGDFITIYSSELI